MMGAIPQTECPQPEVSERQRVATDASDLCTESIRSDCPPPVATDAPSRVAVGLSGGIDSACTALMLKEQGHPLMGLFLYLYDHAEPELQAARAVADRLEIPFYVADLRRVFQEQVVRPYIQLYARGHTPNPCALCNPVIKYGAFIEEARRLGAERVAMGHYARVLATGTDYQLHRPICTRKDQSYLLHSLTQAQLARLLLPLGQVPDKQWVREKVKTVFPTLVQKKESTGMCLMTGGHPGDYLRIVAPDNVRPGAFVTKDGCILGEHKGLPYYTLGQRHGLLSTLNRPMYVIGFEPASNRIILSEDQRDLYVARLWLADVNVINPWNPSAPDPLAGEVQIQVCQWGHRLRGTVQLTTADCAQVIFHEPVRAPMPGQYAVFYQGTRVLGGGRIVRTE